MSRVRTVTPGGTRLLGRPLDSGPEPEGSAVMREGALDSLRPNRTATCLLGPPAAPLHQQEGGLSPAPGATVLCGLHPTPHNGVCEAKLLSRGTPLRVQSTWAWAPSPQRKGRKGTDSTHHSHPDGTKNKGPELPVFPPPTAGGALSFPEPAGLLCPNQHPCHLPGPAPQEPSWTL